MSDDEPRRPLEEVQRELAEALADVGMAIAARQARAAADAASIDGTVGPDAYRPQDGGEPGTG